MILTGDLRGIEGDGRARERRAQRAATRAPRPARARARATHAPAARLYRKKAYC